MQLGDIVHLGDQVYKLVENLGRGYLARVYKAETLPNGQQVVVKVLKREHLQSETARQQFEEEAEVLPLLAAAEEKAGTHYAVRLLDAGLSPRQYPYQVQEFARGEPLLFCLQDFSEAEALQVAQQFLQLLQLAHSVDISLPDMKIEEIFWNSAEEKILVVDWNVVRHGPEECKNDLVRAGAVLFHLFTGRPLRLPPDLQLEGELGYGVPQWSSLSEGLRLIISRSLHREPQKRYSSAEEFHQDLAWQQQILQLAQEKQWRALEECLEQARWDERWERALATCAAALDAGPDEMSRPSWEQHREEMQRELGKDVLRALDQGLAKLAVGEYVPSGVGRERVPGAIEEFETVLRLDSLNRKAYYRLLQAQLELALDRHSYFRSDPQGQDQFEHIKQRLQQIVPELLEQRYDLAEEILGRLRTLPEPAHSILWGLESARQLENSIQSGQLLAEAEAALANEEIEIAQNLLRRALNRTPEEKPWIDPLLQHVEMERSRLAELADLWEQAQQSLVAGDRKETVRFCQQILQLEPLHERAQGILSFLERLDDARMLIEQGQLEQARKMLQASRDIAPPRTPFNQEAEGLLQNISLWSRVEMDRRRLLEEAPRLLSEGRLIQADEQWRDVWQRYQEHGAYLGKAKQQELEDLHAEIMEAIQQANPQILEKGRQFVRECQFERAQQVLQEIIDPPPGLALEVADCQRQAKEGMERKLAAQEFEQKAASATTDAEWRHELAQALGTLLGVSGPFLGPLAFVDAFLLRKAGQLRAYLDELPDLEESLDVLQREPGVSNERSLYDLAKHLEYLYGLEQWLDEISLQDARWPGLWSATRYLEKKQQEFVRRATSLERDLKVRQYLNEAGKCIAAGQPDSAKASLAQARRIVDAGSDLAVRVQLLEEKLKDLVKLVRAGDTLYADFDLYINQKEFDNAADVLQKLKKLYGHAPYLSKKRPLGVLVEQLEQARQEAAIQALEEARQLRLDCRFEEAGMVLQGIDAPPAEMAQEIGRERQFLELGIQRLNQAQRYVHQFGQTTVEQEQIECLEGALKALLGEQSDQLLEFVDQQVRYRAGQLFQAFHRLRALREGLALAQAQLREVSANPGTLEQGTSPPFTQAADQLGELERLIVLPGLGDLRWPGLLQAQDYLQRQAQKLSAKLESTRRHWEETVGALWEVKYGLFELERVQSLLEQLGKAGSRAIREEANRLAAMLHDLVRIEQRLKQVRSRLDQAEHQDAKRELQAVCDTLRRDLDAWSNDWPALAERASKVEVQADELLSQAELACQVQSWIFELPAGLLSEVEPSEEKVAESRGWVSKVRNFVSPKRPPAVNQIQLLPQTTVQINTDRLDEIEREVQRARNIFPEEPDFQALHEELKPVQDLHLWARGVRDRLQGQEPRGLVEPPPWVGEMPFHLAISWLREIAQAEQTFLHGVRRRRALIRYVEQYQWEQARQVIDEIRRDEQLDGTALQAKIQDLQGWHEEYERLSAWRRAPKLVGSPQCLKEHQERVKARIQPLKGWSVLTAIEERLVAQWRLLLDDLEEYFRDREYLGRLEEKIRGHLQNDRLEKILAKKQDLLEFRSHTVDLKKKLDALNELVRHVEKVMDSRRQADPERIDRIRIYSDLDDWLKQNGMVIQGSRLARAIKWAIEEREQESYLLNEAAEDADRLQKRIPSSQGQ